jgi:hypothetical protein
MSVNAHPIWLRNLTSYARSGLFVPQRDHWIDAHGAAGGNVACRDRDQRKQNGHAGNCRRIIRMNVVEHRFQLARHGQRQADAHYRADNRQDHALPHNQP